MKVAQSIRQIFNSRVEIYNQLKEEVDNYFKDSKQPRWHYESRVKALDSFCLKLETSRFNDAANLEDFFGACLVVCNSSELETAISLVEDKFTIKYRRPKEPFRTHKSPSEFVFDDIRLYLEIPKDDLRRPKGIENIVFELQLKTFLQHAWSIATHDLVYKGDNVSWGTSRIAFQVKAMLEHAELSIMESEKLSESPLLNKTNKDFDTDNEVYEFLKAKWPQASLPSDLIRLSNNIVSALKLMSVSWSDAKDICEKSEYVGSSPRQNLSPYASIVIAILANKKKAAFKPLKRKNKRLFIPEEALQECPKNLINEIKEVSFSGL